MEEALHVHNAGLVIPAAFLKRYFSKLELLDGEVFADEAAAIRAALLLEYVASGGTEVAEYQLVFNKVLCGLPISTPVPESVVLTDHEVETTRQMQQAILQNWERMSNSTVENLQGSFLLRDGLLHEGEDHWSLQVQGAGYDILLSSLPWAISVIHLPWMQQRLEVEWKTSII